jgi:hypothetical protein
MCDKLERMWNELIMVYFTVLSQHWPGGMRITTKISNQDSRCPGQDSNWAPSEYKLEVLHSQPTCSVTIRKLCAFVMKPHNNEHYEPYSKLVCVLLLYKHVCYILLTWKSKVVPVHHAFKTGR